MRNGKINFISTEKRLTNQAESLYFNMKPNGTSTMKYENYILTITTALSMGRKASYFMVVGFQPSRPSMGLFYAHEHSTDAPKNASFLAVEVKRRSPEIMKSQKRLLGLRDKLATTLHAITERIGFNLSTCTRKGIDRREAYTHKSEEPLHSRCQPSI